MFSRFSGRKRKPEPAEAGWERDLVWRPAGHPDNPFAMEVLDCRAVALHFVSTTSDESVAQSFSRLRASEGSEVRGCLPEAALQAECYLCFPCQGHPTDGPICLAAAMEDKWDFFAFDRRLYVRRSWTGFLTYVAGANRSQFGTTLESSTTPTAVPPPA